MPNRTELLEHMAQQAGLFRAMALGYKSVPSQFEVKEAERLIRLMKKGIKAFTNLG